MRRAIDGDLCHEIVINELKPSLGFSREKDLNEWKKEARKKFIELLCIDKIKENDCPLNLIVEERADYDSYIKIRFSFESERGAFVPCYLLIPKDGREKHPVVICLQGHTGGFHHSIGEHKNPGDERFQPHTAHAYQAIERGFAALCIEMRGMGERQSKRYPDPTIHPCAITALTALNLGRTVAGERAYDTSKAIDALDHFTEYGIDKERIMILGHSGGGTASFYAACYDERISYAVSCGAFCTYRDSIMDIHHCVCNYIPAICNYFEMGDLCGLIAPRHLGIMTGRNDDIFPIKGVVEGYNLAREIFSLAGCADNVSLTVSESGHVFDPELFWKAIMEETEKMGWNDI
nr:hypothetical protein [Oscillospiraceae bacterium]